MEIIQYKNYIATYQKQGQNKQNYYIYLVNIFDTNIKDLFSKQSDFLNMNYNVSELQKIKLDKYNNLKIVTSTIDITYDIKKIIDNMEV